MTTTTISIFPSVPTTSHQYCPLPKQRHYIISSSNGWSSFSQTQKSFTKFPIYPLLVLHCSSSPTSTSVVEEEDGLLSQPESTPPQDSDSLPPLRGCMACGREEIEKGCNGEGRIQGGIATVPGFGWWPIKAYRPCPGFVASGGRYRRRGQSMDEVAGFGRVERGTSVGEAQSSKKKQGQRRLKR